MNTGALPFLARLWPLIALILVTSPFPAAAQQFTFNQFIAPSPLRDGDFGDLDGDGDVDAMMGMIGTPGIFMARNTGGTPRFEHQVKFLYPPELGLSLNGSPRVTFGDLDGDGDLDVIASFSSPNMLGWQANIDGKGSMGPLRIVDATGSTLDESAVDLDGDGDLDLIALMGVQREIVWYENLDGNGSFGPQRLVADSLGICFGIDTGDLDGDGYQDVLVWIDPPGTIVWYPNTDGQATFGTQNVITTTAKAIFQVIASDLDGDGDLDVIGNSITGPSQASIFWHENIDGLGNFGAANIISSPFPVPGRMAVGDMDGDGDNDLCVESQLLDSVVLTFNTDGEGTFGALQEIQSTNGFRGSLRLADLDSDGAPDIITSSRTFGVPVNWFANKNAGADFSAPSAVAPFVDLPVGLDLADIDGDGDQDVVTASFEADSLIWIDNKNAFGGFTTAHTISQFNLLPNDIVAADLDGNGTMDVLSDSENSESVIWVPNADGLGTFGARRTVAFNTDGPVAVVAVDLNLDGALDALYASDDNQEIAWSENLKGSGLFGNKQVISNTAAETEGLVAADLDGDGDPDVLTASHLNDTLSWFPNSDGAGGFGVEIVITSLLSDPTDVLAADLDGDGDLDVVGASDGSSGATWYPNLDGLGDFSTPIPIGSSTVGDGSLLVGDLDGDGDQDLIIGDDLGCSYWLQNRNGLGVFGEEVLPTDPSGARHLALGDVDGNGSLDLVANSVNLDSIEWYSSNQCTGDPIASFAADTQTGSAPLTILFSNTTTGTGPLAWNWDFGDGTSSTEESPSHVYALDGLYDVTLQATGPAGTCLSTKKGFIGVGMCGSDPLASFAASPTSGEVPLTVQFTNLSVATGLNSWAWDFGDGSTSLEDSPSHTYIQAGTYSVSLSVSGDLGSCAVVQDGLIVAQPNTDASVTFRNGTGVNPAVYTSSVNPVLGTTWVAQQDASTLGATGLSLLFGFSLPLSGVFSQFGELLVDPSSSLLLSDVAIIVGSIATHNIPVPNDTSLAGVDVFTQGFLVTSNSLSNALDLNLGF